MPFFYFIKEFRNTGDLFYIGILRSQVKWLLVNNQILVEGIDRVEMEHEEGQNKSYNTRNYPVNGLFL